MLDNPASLFVLMLIVCSGISLVALFDRPIKRWTKDVK